METRGRHSRKGPRHNGRRIRPDEERYRTESGARLFGLRHGRTWAALVVASALGTSACTLSGTVGVQAGVSGGGGGTGGEATGSGPVGTGVLDVAGETGIGICDAMGPDPEVGECEQKAPPESFEPIVQWAWSGDGELTDVFAAPLVGNLTDDDNSGTIDLCDVPDIVVIVSRPITGELAQDAEPGFIYVLSGADGTVLRAFDDPVSPLFTPALGDVDSDGLTDIVAVRDESAPGDSVRARVVAFAADGTRLWEAASTFMPEMMGAVALADLDNDGDVEIMVDGIVFNHRGELVFRLSERANNTLPFGVDLDGDEDLEVLWGKSAFHHDGTRYFDTGLEHGYGHVANFDTDPQPEIILTNAQGLSLIQHDGTVTIGGQVPLPQVDPSETAWERPAAIHDIDGDGIREIAMSVGQFYVAFSYLGGNARFQEKWTASVADLTGWAGGTAFDFLGDGTAEAMYADETTLYLYDFEGRSILSQPRTSITVQEFPVVADVDNDGSAEIVVVSNQGLGGTPAPAVSVLGEEQGRWVQARRIWNQHTYHVTNVLEDGRVPQFESPHWRRINTFRTNVQIEGGSICTPPPVP